MTGPSNFAPGTSARRRVVRETVVGTDPMDAFESWVDPTRVTRFMGREAHIDLRPLGRYEILFLAEDEAPEGSRGSEGCRLLAYVPGEVLTFTWNAPPHLAGIRPLNTWVVVTFEGRAGGTTQVRLVHTGFGEGEAWDRCVEYFERAWSNVLAGLAAYLGAG